MYLVFLQLDLVSYALNASTGVVFRFMTVLKQVLKASSGSNVNVNVAVKTQW